MAATGVLLIGGHLLIGAGCVAATGQPAPATTAPASTQPAAEVASVTHADFDRLWDAARRAAEDRLFVMDRLDRRHGEMTTEPMISKQFFEPWRRDVVGAAAVAESSLATLRRTVRMEFARLEDGRYSVEPSVEIERYAFAERRVTSVSLYRGAFKRSEARGTRESDRGLYVPSRYWYSLGRDAALEQSLADSIRRRLRD